MGASMSGRGREAVAAPGAFDVARVRSIVRAAVKRKRHLFAAFPDVGEADLLQEALIRAARIHPLYRPGKGSYSTWVTRAANFAIIDLWRKRSRQARHEDVARATAWAMRPGRGEDPARDPPELAAWLTAVHAACRGMWPRRATATAGPRPMATLACAGIMMRRLSIDGPAAAALFEARADLRKVLGLDQAPSATWFARAAAVIAAPNRGRLRDAVDAAPPVPIGSGPRPPAQAARGEMA